MPRGQGHWTLFLFWGRGCLQRTRRTRKLTANCTWPKTGTPKLRYRRPPRVGPTVRVSGCTEAQRPSMVPGGWGGVSQAWVGPQHHHPSHPLPGHSRCHPCLCNPPLFPQLCPWPCGSAYRPPSRGPHQTLSEVPCPRKLPSTGQAWEPAQFAGQSLPSQATREIAMGSQPRESGEEGLVGKGPLEPVVRARAGVQGRP